MVLSPENACFRRVVSKTGDAELLPQSRLSLRLSFIGIMRVPIERSVRHSPDRNSETYHRIVCTKLKNPQQTSDYRAHPALITIELGDEDAGCPALKRPIKFEGEISFFFFVPRENWI